MLGNPPLSIYSLGERLSIITNKAQTTRHRIMGIVNTDDYQIVYSDTPGLVNSAYALHDSMMGFVQTALQDADIIPCCRDRSTEPQPHGYLRKTSSDGCAYHCSA